MASHHEPTKGIGTLNSPRDKKEAKGFSPIRKLEKFSPGTKGSKSHLDHNQAPRPHTTSAAPVVRPGGVTDVGRLEAPTINAIGHGLQSGHPSSISIRGTAICSSSGDPLYRLAA